jgi:uncharacterized cupin superfamily protein
MLRPMSATSLLTTYLRLKPDASAEQMPAEEFWPKLMSGQLGDFHNEYLVTTAQYTANWPEWECHPLGDEIVCLISGHVTLVQEKDGSQTRVELSRAGDFGFNARGTWHTADVHVESLLLFITAGEGTTIRPRT